MLASLLEGVASARTIYPFGVHRKIAGQSPQNNFNSTTQGLFLAAPDGTLLEKAGTVRDGGSFEARMGAVACWNAVMDENDYMVRKWNEFIAA